MLISYDKNDKQGLKFLLLMIFAMVLWGSSWISAKLIAGEASSETIAFWRLLFTFISFVPIMILKKEPFALNKKELFLVITSGFLFALYNKLFFMGLKTGLAGKGGIIVTTLNPVFTFFITITFLKYKASPLQITGLILGLSGGAILIKIWDITIDELIKSGNLYFVLGAFTWALLTVVGQHTQKALTFIAFCFYMYGFASLFSFVFAIHKEPFSVLECGVFFWAHILFLSVIVVSIATTLYFIASAKIGSNKASSFTFLVPCVAIFFAWLILNEIPDIQIFIGGSLSLIAIYLINIKPEN